MIGQQKRHIGRHKTKIGTITTLHSVIANGEASNLC
jgi:hypothetical protein